VRTAAPLTVHDGNLSLAPAGHPAAAQRKAVAAAELWARPRLALPKYELRWVRAPGSVAWGCTRYAPVRIFLRDDLSPAQCYTTALHELKHASDEADILELTTEQAERRAETFAAAGGQYQEEPMIESVLPTVTTNTDSRRRILGDRAHAIVDRAERVPGPSRNGPA
jgi:hypothetical protein